MEAVLRERLAARPGISTLTGVELLDFETAGDAVKVRLRLADGAMARVQTRFLVGADGASSPVRQALGIPFGGRTFAQDWLVVDARHVPNPIADIEFICDPARPSPHMVAPGDRQRWEFMLRPGETREQMEQPATVRRLLAPWARAEDIEIERVAVYRFHARLADAFSQGRVFLAGDAAHITPPFAGQGLVAGLRDAANLCWKLAWVVQGRAASTILDSYSVERRPHAKAMINLALFLGKLVMPSNRVAAFLTHGMMSLMGFVPRLRRLFEELEIKPQNRFANGLFAPQDRAARLVRGGLLPQGWVRSPVDHHMVLSDEALGTSLALIGFGVDPAQSLETALRSGWAQAGGTLLQFLPRGMAASTATPSWEDLAGVLVPGTAPVGWVAVVRPDRTIIVDGPLSDAPRMVRQTLGLLGASDATETPAAALR